MTTTTTDIAKPGPLMAGKRGLVMGVANDRSIAWGIARVLHGQGADLAFSYQGGAFGRRAVPLAQSIGAKIIEEADVEDLDSVRRVFDVIRKKWGSLDFVVHALAFSDSGDRAYVTCSAVDRVDVIDTSTYTVVRSIDIPARNPRGIAYLGSKAYVVSFLSGNGTAPRGTAADPDAVEFVGRPALPTENPLPDMDLFVIPTQPSPAQDDLDPSATLTGLGTILFNIHARPGTTELWIPNTDALNADHRGEVNFVAGQFVSNRITIVDASGAAPPTPTRNSHGPIDMRSPDSSGAGWFGVSGRAFTSVPARLPTSDTNQRPPCAVKTQCWRDTVGSVRTMSQSIARPRRAG